MGGEEGELELGERGEGKGEFLLTHEEGLREGIEGGETPAEEGGEEKGNRGD